MKYFVLFLSVLSVVIPLEAKLLVITHAYKRSDFIALQDKTFREFLKDDYQFVVFNDARDEKIFRSICKTCSKLGIPCINIPQEIHSLPYLPRQKGDLYDHPCITCANVVQYSLDTLGFDHEGLVMIIDSDMFLVDELSVADYMQGCDLSGLSQSRGHVEYLWNGILFFNMDTLPQKRELCFNCGNIEGQPCDAGGYTYYYLKNHPEAHVKFVGGHTYVGNHMDEDRENFHPFLKLMVEENIPNSEFFLNYKFFHYRGGGNWDYKSNSYHRHKTKALHKLVELAIQSHAKGAD